MASPLASSPPSLSPIVNSDAKVSFGWLQWFNAIMQLGIGTSTNDSAAIGNVGEFQTITVAVGAALSLSNGVSKTVTALALTAGDWELTGQVDYSLTGTTGTSMSSGFSLTTNTLPSQPGGSGLESDPLAIVPLSTTTLTGTFSHVLKPTRLSLALTTTVYLIANHAFTVGTSKAYGTLSARRMR